MVRRAGKSMRGKGVSLLELIIATSILLILFGAAAPVISIKIRRERECELRNDLWDMRNAIDRYKQAADRGLFQVKVGAEGYPPDLETLMRGVETAGGVKVRFLRRVPIDPMTGTTDWGLHSVQDDPTSEGWGGQNVFDVYSKSNRVALDGSHYRDW